MIKKADFFVALLIFLTLLAVASMGIVGISIYIYDYLFEVIGQFDAFIIMSAGLFGGLCIYMFREVKEIYEELVYHDED